jgi:hypothetical protein
MTTIWMKRIKKLTTTTCKIRILIPFPTTPLLSVCPKDPPHLNFQKSNVKFRELTSRRGSADFFRTGKVRSSAALRNRIRWNASKAKWTNLARRTDLSKKR